MTVYLVLIVNVNERIDNMSKLTNENFNEVNGGWRENYDGSFVLDASEREKLKSVGYYVNASSQNDVEEWLNRRRGIETNPYYNNSKYFDVNKLDGSRATSDDIRKILGRSDDERSILDFARDGWKKPVLFSAMNFDV